jgi:dihydropteroate synthase
MRAIFQWNLGSRVLELGRRTLIMGVVNVTPDSFSDGGQFIDAEKAVLRAEQLLDEGATIIDVGGESTRPGSVTGSGQQAGTPAPVGSELAPTSEPVSEEEERRRVLPVIRDLKRRRPNAVVSIDTYKAGVARAAVELGAEVVNDVSGFRWDPRMAKTLAELKVGAVLMHSRGRPSEWKGLPPIGDPVLAVKRDLRQWAELATLAGIKRDRLVLDPGFGFGKRFEENYPLLAHFGELQQMGFPLLAGASRKSFIGRMLARDSKDAPITERLYGTLAAEVALILKGAHMIRTHDVRSAVEAARVADTIVASGG